MKAPSLGRSNGRGTNAEHAMAKGAKSTEKMERRIGELGRRRMHRPLLRVRTTKLRA